MPKHQCPLCNALTVQTADGVAVCPYCETCVSRRKLVTVITPRPMIRR